MEPGDWCKPEVMKFAAKHGDEIIVENVNVQQALNFYNLILLHKIGSCMIQSFKQNLEREKIEDTPKINMDLSGLNLIPKKLKWYINTRLKINVIGHSHIIFYFSI